MPRKKPYHNLNIYIFYCFSSDFSSDFTSDEVKERRKIKRGNKIYLQALHGCLQLMSRDSG